MDETGPRLIPDVGTRLGVPFSRHGICEVVQPVEARRALQIRIFGRVFELVLRVSMILRRREGGARFGRVCSSRYLDLLIQALRYSRVEGWGLERAAEMMVVVDKENAETRRASEIRSHNVIHR